MSDKGFSVSLFSAFTAVIVIDETTIIADNKTPISFFNFIVVLLKIIFRLFKRKRDGCRRLIALRQPMNKQFSLNYL